MERHLLNDFLEGYIVTIKFRDAIQLKNKDGRKWVY